APSPGRPAARTAVLSARPMQRPRVHPDALRSPLRVLSPRLGHLRPGGPSPLSGSTTRAARTRCPRRRRSCSSRGEPGYSITFLFQAGRPEMIWILLDPSLAAPALLLPFPTAAVLKRRRPP